MSILLSVVKRASVKLPETRRVGKEKNVYCYEIDKFGSFNGLKKK